MTKQVTKKMTKEERNEQARLAIEDAQFEIVEDIKKVRACLEQVLDPKAPDGSEERLSSVTIVTAKMVHDVYDLAMDDEGKVNIEQLTDDLCKAAELALDIHSERSPDTVLLVYKDVLANLSDEDDEDDEDDSN